MAENRIADMKSQLDDLKEIQDHPIKNALQKTIKTLETKVAEIKEQIADLKSGIIEGCKNAVSAFKENGISALDKLASFFQLKSGLQAVKNNIDKVIDTLDKAVNKIEMFSKEFHEAGRHLKNAARLLIGKEPIDTAKESGKLAKAVCTPYNAQKKCLVGINTQINKIIKALNRIEQSAENNRGKQAEANGKNNRGKQTEAKKPTLMQRIEEKKALAKQNEHGKQAPGRAPKAKGHEV